MRSNKKSLAEAQAYLILDAEVLDHRSLLRVLKDSVRGGVDIVQLRDKKSTAREILEFCREILKITGHKIPFIINDRADLCLLSSADGLHLGQDDLEYAQARKLLGQKKIIGVSCQNLNHALKAERDGADYIGFGSVFETKTKPGRQKMDLGVLKHVTQKIKIPLFPIGGISRGNIREVMAIGATRAAVCRDILLAQDPAKAVRELKGLLKKGDSHHF